MSLRSSASLLLLMLLPVACTGRTPEASAPADPIALATSVSTSPRFAPAPADMMTIGLTRDGRVLVEGEDVTLAELSRRIRKRAEAKETHEPTGTKVAVLTCRLRVDGAACWQHVAWILTVMAEEKVLHAQFALRDRDGKEQAVAWDLPCDVWRGYGEAPALRFLFARVAIDAKGGMRCGDFASFEAADLQRFVAESRSRLAADAPDGFAAELAAARAAPWGASLAALEMLLAAGAERVDFYGTTIPRMDERELRKLPWPPASAAPPKGLLTIRRGDRAGSMLTIEEEEEPEITEGDKR